MVKIKFIQDVQTHEVINGKTVRGVIQAGTIQDVSDSSARLRIENGFAEIYQDNTPVITDELDSVGVPYNPEFHTANKSMKNDGTWKLKKGVDKAAAETYTAQYDKSKEIIEINKDFFKNIRTLLIEFNFSTAVTKLKALTSEEVEIFKDAVTSDSLLMLSSAVEEVHETNELKTVPIAELIEALDEFSQAFDE